MTATMSVTDAVFEAIRYFRYRGAALSAIDSYAGVRAELRNFTKKRKRALTELEQEQKIERRGKLWFVHPSLFQSVRGPSYKPEFEQTDFGVLLAIFAHKDGCDLFGLIKSFDFIMRTLPCYDELYGALNRLFSARLITQKSGLFYATSLAAKLWNLARSHSKKTLYGEYFALERIVRCPCCGPHLEKVSWRIALHEDAFNNGMTQYTSMGP